MRVLVVDDEPELCEAVARRLAARGDVVETAGTIAEAEDRLDQASYDVLVLDRGLPDGDGVDALARWRAGGHQLPVLVLTARAEVAERVEGLSRGADDYLAKPFAMAELFARLAVLGRRGPAPLPLELRVADLRLDLARREVRRAGIVLPLRAKEYAVLELMMRRQGRIVTRAEIRQHAWGDLDSRSNVEEATIASLRRKLGPPSLIHTRRGQGYVLEAARD